MSSSKTPCAACKTLRRKCINECVFAPYFPPDQPQRFETVHRVYGASNVAKILTDLPAAERVEAVTSLVYEAEARLKDPVYGCVGSVSILQHRLKQIQTEIQAAKQELATYIGPSAINPGLVPNQQVQIQHQQQQSMDLLINRRSFDEQQLVEEQDMLRNLEHRWMMCDRRRFDGVGSSSQATHGGLYVGQQEHDHHHLEQLLQHQLLLQQQNQPSQPQPNHGDRSSVDP